MTMGQFNLLQRPALLRYGSHALAALTATFVLVGSALAMFQPLHMKRQMIQHEAMAALDLLRRGESLKARYDGAVAEQRVLRQRLEEVVNKMPPSIDEAKFVHQLSNLAVSKDVTLSKFTPGGHQRLGGHGAIEIQISGKGKYPAVCEFLHALPGVARIFSIDRLALSAAEGSGDACNFEITFRLLYSQPALVPGEET
jgi:Tfp pilus assembly protein PilO